VSDVHFLPAATDEGPYTMGRKVEHLFARLGVESRYEPGMLVGVKVHLGETGGPAPMPPAWLRPTVERLRQRGALPFYTDSCTLYRGGRSNAVAHLRTAAERGFQVADAGAPFVVADGLLGEAALPVAIAGRHFREVEIAGVAARAPALLVFSHFTGHLGASFGAAIKNLGMGLASRAGKLQQHAVAKPQVDTAMCAGCGVCLEVCPVEAIRLQHNVAVIDPEVCTGCGQCMTVCYMEGIDADYGAHTQLLQERMTEYALGAVKGKEGRCAYITFLVKVTRDCDCLGKTEPALFPDIGLVGGADPVAVDQAACDLVVEHTGRPIHEHCGRTLDPRFQLAHGEAIGLGSRTYRLHRVAAP
jgi:uncharacterized Fe-S center protein